MADPIQPYNADANGNPVQNLYKFPDSDSMVTTRLRRVEKTVPLQRRGDPVFTSAVSQGVDPNILSTTGAIDIASSNVQKIGAMAPNGVTGSFAAVTTGTTITWYWDGTNGSNPLVIHRADGTTFAVPRGSIAVTGLANSTTYYFLPFWSTTGGCQPGWVIATHGLPQIAFVLADTTDPTTAQFYLAQQTLQNREQLANGFMTQATTASGGSGGGSAGGGGAHGNCVMSGTAIEPIGDGTMEQRITAQNRWIRVCTYNGKCLYGTYDHPIYACIPEEQKELDAAYRLLTEEALEPFKMTHDEVEPGYLAVTNEGLSEIVEVAKIERMCSKRSVHLSEGHLFWANGILSHNKAIGGG